MPGAEGYGRAFEQSTGRRTLADDKESDDGLHRDWGRQEGGLGGRAPLHVVAHEAEHRAVAHRELAQQLLQRHEADLLATGDVSGGDGAAQLGLQRGVVEVAQADLRAADAQLGRRLHEKVATL